MPTETATLIQQITASTIAVAGAFVAIYKFINLTKSFNKIKKDIGEIMKTQDDKIVDIRSRFDKLNSSMTGELLSRDENLRSTYITKKSAVIEFDRSKRERDEMYVTLSNKLDNIERLITESRTREIDDLRQQLRDKERR